MKELIEKLSMAIVAWYDRHTELVEWEWLLVRIGSQRFTNSARDVVVSFTIGTQNLMKIKEAPQFWIWQLLVSFDLVYHENRKYTKNKKVCLKMFYKNYTFRLCTSLGQIRMQRTITLIDIDILFSNYRSSEVHPT